MVKRFLLLSARHSFEQLLPLKLCRHCRLSFVLRTYKSSLQIVHRTRSFAPDCILKLERLPSTIDEQLADCDHQTLKLL